METELSKEKEALLYLIIRNLRSAIKNGVLYTPGHPVFDFSVKTLKNSIDKWFLFENSLNLGITHNNILLNGVIVKDKDDFFDEVADFLYRRSINTIVFFKEITFGELIDFFKIIKEDVKVIRQGGGIVKKLFSLPHLKITEIDYSSILTEVNQETAESKKTWQSFLDIAKESAANGLPASKIEFLSDLLKDTDKSALLLNRIYAQTREKLEQDVVVENTHTSFAKMYRYLGEASHGNIESKKKLMNVIAKLDPGFASSLFEKESVGDNTRFNLAQQIAKDFPDDFIADFMTSLISGEYSINENLLKIFDKLNFAKGNKGSSIVSLVADKLFKEENLSDAIISKLQSSIKELFKVNPHSTFMSQMYKIMVHTVIDNAPGKTSISMMLEPVIQKYMFSVKETALIISRSELLIDILWLEDNILEFIKFGKQLRAILLDLITARNISIFAKALTMLTEKAKTKHALNREMSLAAVNMLKEITDRQILAKIISIVPHLNGEELKDAARVISTAGHDCGQLLIDAFVAPQYELRQRQKIALLFSGVNRDISAEIALALEKKEFSIIRDCLEILNKIGYSRMNTVVKKLIYHKDEKIQLEALKNYKIEMENEKNVMLEMFKKERNEKNQTEIMMALLKTEDKQLINEIFKYSKKRFLKRGLLSQFVELSGYLKLKESMPFLKKILFQWSLFDTKRKNKLRMSAAVSLLQLGTEDAIALLEKGLLVKNKQIRRVCGIMSRLKESKTAKTDR
ncbi:MAG: hypothetical protein ABH836_07245 [Candidatus Omnitrophota bacterium]